MKAIPPIKTVMTPFPYWVDGGESMEEASRLIAEHGVRHLAVKERDELIGVITELEIERARGLHPASGELRARDLCGRQAYVVGLSEPLDRVLLHMAEHHLDSALVVKDGKLAGIFTTSDACRHFGRLLRTLFPAGGGDEAA